MNVKGGVRVQIANVSNRWKRQYYKHGEWYGPDKLAIWERLSALDVATATASDVEAIIGNGSWVGYRCGECSESVSNVVLFGDDDGEGMTICRPCLTKALAMLNAIIGECQ